MDEKYKKAILAGMICGIILVVLSLISNVGFELAFGADLQNWAQQLANTNYDPSQGFPQPPAGAIIYIFGYFAIIAFGVLTFFVSGLLAARMAAPYLKNRNDILIAGAIAGAVAELVHQPFSLLFTLVMSLIQPTNYTYSGMGSGLMSAIVILGEQIIVCFPVLLITGVILAVLGALLYSFIKPMPKDTKP